MIGAISRMVKRAGKVAVFTVGAAMLFALVFGVATTAFGATGGNSVLVRDTSAPEPSGVSIT
jgi:hypothetical protein